MTAPTYSAQPIWLVRDPSRTAAYLEVLLANVLLGVLLFPYASPVPIQTDVQPFAVVFAFMSMMLLIFVRGGVWHFDRTDLYLLFFALLYAVYVDWSVQVFDLYYFRKNAIMLLAFPAYWAVKHLYPRMSGKTVLVVAWMYLVITLSQKFAPPLFNLFSRMFLPRVVGMSSARGLTGPCPEQSFLAFIALSFPIVYRMVMANGQKVDPSVDRRRFRTIVVLSVILTLLARSVTGTAFTAALLGVMWLASARDWMARLRRVVAGVGVMALVATVGVNVVGYRTAYLIRLVASHPSLILLDSSIASRYVQVLAGLYTFAMHPLGTGRSVGNKEVFETAATGLRYDAYIPRESMDYVRSNRNDRGDILILSPFADSLSRMGILFVVHLMLLLAVLRYRPYSLASRTYLLLGIISSFPLSFPIFWLLLGAHEGWFHRKRVEAALGLTSPVPVPA